MPRVAIVDLQPGQVTASPVTSASGIVLVQAATELSAALITRLREAGISTVAVAAPALTGEARARRLAEIEARFSGHEASAWMQALKAIVVRLQAGATTDPPDA
jgi:hypothetical protein